MRDDPVGVLNFVTNQPEVLQEVAPGYEYVDMSAFITRPGNYMFGDDRGVALFAHIGRNVYEIHFLFTSALRGVKALRVVRAALETMFTLHGAYAIVGATPRDNLPCRMVGRALGFRPTGVSSTDLSGRSCLNYILERDTWAISLAESSAA